MVKEVDRSTPQSINDGTQIMTPRLLLEPTWLGKDNENKTQFQKVPYHDGISEYEPQEVSHLFQGKATVIAQTGSKYFVLHTLMNDRLYVGPGTTYAIVTEPGVQVLTAYPESIGPNMVTTSFSPDELSPKVVAEFENAKRQLKKTQAPSQKTRHKSTQKRIDEREKNSGIVYIIKDGGCYSTPDSYTDPTISENRFLENFRRSSPVSVFAQEIYDKHLALFATDETRLTREQRVILSVITLTAQQLNELLNIDELQKDQIIPRLSEYWTRKEEKEFRKHPVVEKMEKGEITKNDEIEYVLHYQLPVSMKRGNFLESAVTYINHLSVAKRDMRQPITFLENAGKLETQSPSETTESSQVFPDHDDKLLTPVEKLIFSNNIETFIMGFHQLVSLLGLRYLGFFNAKNYARYREAFEALNMKFDQETFASIRN